MRVFLNHQHVYDIKSAIESNNIVRYNKIISQLVPKLFLHTGAISLLYFIWMHNAAMIDATEHTLRKMHINSILPVIKVHNANVVKK